MEKGKVPTPGSIILIEYVYDANDYFYNVDLWHPLYSGSLATTCDKSSVIWGKAKVINEYNVKFFNPKTGEDAALYWSIDLKKISWEYAKDELPEPVVNRFKLIMEEV